MRAKTKQELITSLFYPTTKLGRLTKLLAIIFCFTVLPYFATELLPICNQHPDKVALWALGLFTVLVTAIICYLVSNVIHWVLTGSWFQK